MLCSRFSLTIYFMHSINRHICQSQSSSSPHHPLCCMVSIHSFSRSVFLFLFCKHDHLNHFFFRVHIHALVFDICFSLSALHYFAWQSLGPSTSPQMTQFGSSLWLSSIPLYMCTTSSLSIPLLMDIPVVSMSWLLQIGQQHHPQ